MYQHITIASLAFIIGVGLTLLINKRDTSPSASPVEGFKSASNVGGS